jgi:hypothetical protein
MSDGKPERTTEQRRPGGRSVVKAPRGPAVMQSALLIHRFKIEGVAFGVMGFLVNSGPRVGRLFGQPKCFQSCSLFSNSPSLRRIGRLSAARST